MNRNDFKLLNEVVYLDSAAAILKPKQVVTAIGEFYNDYPINPHSVDSSLGVKIMQKVNETRELSAELIDASSNEVIFTSGTTDSINKIANMSQVFLKKDDEILISFFNHSSNIIPWIEMAKKVGAKLVYSDDLLNDINPKTKIVAYSQMNNSLYQHFDKKRLYKEVKKNGAILINDAAQAIVHEEVSLHDADVVVFSGNKLYGPTGIGVLAIKKELLALLKPTTYGGGANLKIKDMEWIPKEGVEAYEAGTINTAGIVGLGEAIKYFNENHNYEHELEIAEYAFDKLSAIDGIKMYSKRGDTNILFNIKEYASQDVVSYLGHKNIILRSGTHCAKALNEIVDFQYSIRMSIATYNNKEDIDKTINAINEGGDFIEFV